MLCKTTPSLYDEPREPPSDPSAPDRPVVYRRIRAARAQASASIETDISARFEVLLRIGSSLDTLIVFLPHPLVAILPQFRNRNCDPDNRRGGLFDHAHALRAAIFACGLVWFGPAMGAGLAAPALAVSAAVAPQPPSRSRSLL